MIKRGLLIIFYLCKYFIYKLYLSLTQSGVGVVFISHDVDRGYKFNGKYYSQLLDSINDSIRNRGISTLSIPKSTSEIKKKYTYGNVLKINDIWFGSIYYQSISNRLKKSSVPIAQRRINAWKEILSLAKPKVIIAISPSLEVCIAAKNLGIYVFDMQHGLIPEVGTGYYDTSYRESFDQKGWPDCILCWDKRTKKWIEEKNHQLVSARVIGSPFILRFYQNNANDKLVEEAYEKLNRYLNSNKNTKKILVTIQWGYEHLEGIFKLGIPQSVIELIKRGDKEYEWWIRFHPVTLNKLGEKNVFRICSDEFLKLTNVNYVIPSILPLPSLLNKADLHVTYASATVKEASLFSVKTAMLYENHDKLKEWFSNEIEKGDATIVNNTSTSLNQWIKNFSDRIDKNYSELNELTVDYEKFINDLSYFLDTNDSNVLFNKQFNS